MATLSHSLYRYDLGYPRYCSMHGWVKICFVFLRSLYRVTSKKGIFALKQQLALQHLMYWRHSLNFDIDIDTCFDHEKLFVPLCVFLFSILTKWNVSNLGFLGISHRTHWGNGLKWCTLMYLGHLQNWLVYGYGLLIFLIVALFWLSEMGQIWGFRVFHGERIEGMAWNFACGCILTTFKTD